VRCGDACRHQLGNLGNFWSSHGFPPAKEVLVGYVAGQTMAINSGGICVQSLAIGLCYLDEREADRRAERRF
jgi:hypothetical protein